MQHILNETLNLTQTFYKLKSAKAYKLFIANIYNLSQ